MSKNTNLRKITNYLTADNNTLSSNVSQTITGSLTVTGNLTAQQFILSSSVTYLTESFASGSHKFGDSSDDIHTFTGSLVVSGSANPLRVGSNLLFVSSSGNVGIGTSSPETYGLFVVNGTAASTGISTIIRNQTDTGGDNTRYAGIDFMIGSDNGTASIRAFRTNSASDYSTALTFWTKGSGANATIPTQRMRIASNGDVIFPESRVINTTASSGYLAFYGNGGGVYWGGSAANQMFLSSSGNLGIGTLSPGTVLQVNGAITSASGGVTLPNATWVTIYTFNASDIMMGTISFTTDGTHASSVCLFNKTYNGGGGALVIGGQANQGAGNIQVSGNSLQVMQSVGAGTLGGTWWLTRLGGN
jgi:hypothetical protein